MTGKVEHPHAQHPDGDNQVRPSASARPTLARGPPAGAGFGIVAIGASAGGLDACTRLIEALPAETGMAFILVQHLEPTHASMMASLLAEHTTMTVEEATEGQQLQPDHLYIIPPGTSLAVADGALRLSRPLERHGARLPFDFLLNSLGAHCGPRTVGVVLSGTGADGSMGIAALRHAGGMVIVQDPDDAEYDGMPHSAILTGAVDLVLPIREMPAALARFARKVAAAPPSDPLAPGDCNPGALVEIVELLRTTTPHDFRFYKPGTLQRRIDRRIDLARIPAGDTGAYLDRLREDPTEREDLARDLLINVTSFFRDPEAFALLKARIIPDLIRDRPGEQPLRIWVAGCSSGEETYSIGMLVQEAIAEAGRATRVSDVRLGCGSRCSRHRARGSLPRCDRCGCLAPAASALLRQGG